MKKFFNKNLKKIKKALIVLVLIYVAYILINQQKTLNSYENSKEYYGSQIKEKNSYYEELMETKTNITSDEYIEKIAREKLDMYFPNERVYISN